MASMGIVACVYEEIDGLETFILSLKVQHPAPDQVVIVDDGSTLCQKEHECLCKKAGFDYHYLPPRITYDNLSLKHRASKVMTMGRTLNYGLDNIQTNAVVCIYGDYIFAPDFMSVLVSCDRSKIILPVEIHTPYEYSKKSAEGDPRRYIL